MTRSRAGASRPPPRVTINGGIDIRARWSTLMEDNGRPIRTLVLALRACRRVSGVVLGRGGSQRGRAPARTGRRFVFEEGGPGVSDGVPAVRTARCPSSGFATSVELRRMRESCDTAAGVRPARRGCPRRAGVGGSARWRSGHQLHRLGVARNRNVGASSRLGLGARTQGGGEPETGTVQRVRRAPAARAASTRTSRPAESRQPGVRSTHRHGRAPRPVTEALWTYRS